MEKIVTWTKGVFDSSYQIFCDGQICGNLIFETWNNHALGIMSKKNYHFRSNGFSNVTTTIYGDHNEQLGVITYHPWQLKATVVLKDQTPFSWGYTNGWLSQWDISNYQDTQLHYKASTGAGTVHGQNLDHELALLAGIYIKEFFSRILVSLIFFIVITVTIRQI
ncbi:hypothetical protein [Pedobacter sp. ASV28]|uniref:hypothetical protein n=1 Tax=Pedobacter sp. ASV28 TaxID=2795123 RepID=UPI0018ED4FCE|nr:hypothetical protein [Pedobacter sp. ASV28]